MRYAKCMLPSAAPNSAYLTTPFPDTGAKLSSASKGGSAIRTSAKRAGHDDRQRRPSSGPGAVMQPANRQCASMEPETKRCIMRGTVPPDVSIPLHSHSDVHLAHEFMGGKKFPISNSAWPSPRWRARRSTGWSRPSTRVAGPSSKYIRITTAITPVSAEDADAPAYNVFMRKGGKIRHFWGPTGIQSFNTDAANLKPGCTSLTILDFCGQQKRTGHR
jgi:hypothetical protein